MYIYKYSDLVYITASCHMAYLVLQSDVILTYFIDFCMRNTAIIQSKDFTKYPQRLVRAILSRGCVCQIRLRVGRFSDVHSPYLSVLCDCLSFSVTNPPPHFQEVGMYQNKNEKKTFRGKSQP